MSTKPLGKTCMSVGPVACFQTCISVGPVACFQTCISVGPVACFKRYQDISHPDFCHQTSVLWTVYTRVQCLVDSVH